MLRGLEGQVGCEVVVHACGAYIMTGIQRVCVQENRWKKEKSPNRPHAPLVY
jgi:hypothetical protein